MATLFLLSAQFSPLLAFYAAEARNYGLWFLTVSAAQLALTIWLTSFLAPLHEAQRKRWLAALAWGGINAAGLWTHLFHLFFVAAQAAIVMLVYVTSRDRISNHKSFVAGAATSVVITFMLFSPWLAALFQQVQSGQAGVGWVRPFSFMNLPYYLFAAHFGMSLGPNLADMHVKSTETLLFAEYGIEMALAATILAGSALTYATIVVRGASQREHRWELLPFVIGPAVMVLPPLLYAAVWQFPLHIRHFLNVWALLPVTLAVGATRSKVGGCVFIATFALQLYSLGNLLFNEYYGKDDARSAIEFVEARADESAFVLGNVAPYYCQRASGRKKSFHDFPASTKEIWLLYNRPWERPSIRSRRRLEEKAKSLGMVHVESHRQFRGIELEHWRVPE